MSQTNLVDALPRHNQIDCPISTYNGGTKRLDYILTSPATLPFIRNAGYLPFFEGISTDHRGLFLNLDKALHDQSVMLMLHPRHHSIGTQQGNKHSKVRKTMWPTYTSQQFQDQHIYGRALLLQQTYNTMPQAELQMILDHFNDRVETNIALQAEQKFAKSISQWHGRYPQNPHVQYINPLLDDDATRPQDITQYH
jgi:hypothetical protein